MFDLERDGHQPFDVRVPELPGWQRNRGSDQHGDGIGLQRRDTLSEDFHSPTAMITIHVGDPIGSAEEAVASNRRMAESSARDWRTRDDIRIATCGLQGGMVTGDFSGGQWWADRRVLVYVSGDTVYPIYLSARTELVDLDRLGGDMAEILDGVQVSD